MVFLPPIKKDFLSGRIKIINQDMETEFFFIYYMRWIIRVNLSRFRNICWLMKLCAKIHYRNNIIKAVHYKIWTSQGARKEDKSKIVLMRSWNDKIKLLFEVVKSAFQLGSRKKKGKRKRNFRKQFLRIYFFPTLFYLAMIYIYFIYIFWG